MTRRRSDKPTVRIPHQTLRDVAQEWHHALNDSPRVAPADAQSNGLRGDGQPL